MRFELSDDQRLLRDATTDFLSNESPMATSRAISEAEGEGFSRQQWKKLAELGYLGLLAPEAAGGQALGAIELAVVLQQMGRVCFAGPYLDVVLAAKVLEAAGGRDELLSAVVVGDRIVTIARADGIWPTEGNHVRFADGRVEGTKVFVPFAESADVLLVTTDAGLVLAEAPFEVEAMPTLDEAQRFSKVTLSGAADLIGGNNLIDEVADLAEIGAAAVALGICEAALEASVRYATERETFGKPIGVYQVLQHRMADMVLRTESSRATVFRAAWCVDNDSADRAIAVAAAKQYAVESANRIARDALQIHGGNGFTWEYDIHRWLKLAVTLDQRYGSRDELLERALAEAEAL